MNDLSYIQAPQSLAKIQARTGELGFTMASEPRTGALLQTLAASKSASRLLELGMGTGVATAWLLSGMDATSTLISVDKEERVQAVAREALGADPRLTLIIKDGAEFLRAQSEGSFDLVFADAMPGKYEALDEALAVVRPGGFYVIDDLLPQPNWPEGHAEKVPVLLQRLAEDTRFHMMPLLWASGVAVLVRKSA